MLKIAPKKKIDLIDLREGMVVVGFKHHMPSICTKVVKLDNGDIRFRIENNDGSFWGQGNLISEIDACKVTNFLRRLM